MQKSPCNRFSSITKQKVIGISIIFSRTYGSHKANNKRKKKVELYLQFISQNDYIKITEATKSAIVADCKKTK